MHPRDGRTHGRVKVHLSWYTARWPRHVRPVDCDGMFPRSPPRRSSITFATEPVTASLRHAIAASDRAHSASAAATGAGVDSARANGQYRSRADPQDQQDLELDEVEIQKGMSQLGKGLQFLHESAKLVHGNLTPEAVLINDKVGEDFLFSRPTSQCSMATAGGGTHPSVVTFRACPLRITDLGWTHDWAGRLEVVRVRLVSEPVLARRRSGEMGIPDL